MGGTVEACLLLNLVVLKEDDLPLVAVPLRVRVEFRKNNGTKYIVHVDLPMAEVANWLPSRYCWTTDD